MMLVKCYVGPSSIEGFGLFAAEPIKAGETIYRFDPNFDKVFSRAAVKKMPKQAREFIKRYSTFHPNDPKKLVLDSDEGRFMNHSSDPNTVFQYPLTGVALKAISPGTELTANYKEFRGKKN